MFVSLVKFPSKCPENWQTKVQMSFLIHCSFANIRNWAHQDKQLMALILQLDAIKPLQKKKAKQYEGNEKTLVTDQTMEILCLETLQICCFPSLQLSRCFTGCLAHVFHVHHDYPSKSVSISAFCF